MLSHIKIHVPRFGNESATQRNDTVGFESSEIARWRLSSLVSADDTLGHVLCDALTSTVEIATTARAEPETPVAALDALGRDALDTPGAGANFLTAFAAQSRALRLIWQMHERGVSPLPADVVAALRQALKAEETVWC